jgi:alpha-tubulin suppressor-like RCC1 family protein
MDRRGVSSGRSLALAIGGVLALGAAVLHAGCAEVAVDESGLAQAARPRPELMSVAPLFSPVGIAPRRPLGSEPAPACAPSCRWACVRGVCEAPIAVTVGAGHSCALRASGAVECWGASERGQLGDGGTEDRAIAAAVVELPGRALAIDAGDDHTCALLDDGGIACWGANESGQLGDGSRDDRAAPVRVLLAEPADEVAAGGAMTCARERDGDVVCWGTDGFAAARAFPAVIEGVSRAIDIDVGGAHGCAVDDEGSVACWGTNARGQLGDGSLDPRAHAVAVPGLAPSIAVRLGGSHSCAIDERTHALCWGANDVGQLGDGTTIDRATPSAPHNSVLSAGGDRTCGRITWGEIACWGRGYGATPVMVENLSEGRQISIGPEHGCAVHVIGVPRCWGANESGQLGDGTTEGSAIPVDALAPPSV